jgi:hypothetical protein
LSTLCSSATSMNFLPLGIGLPIAFAIYTHTHTYLPAQHNLTL